MESSKIQKLQRWLGTGSINIFGRPFSGKDTQAKRLAEIFDTISISSGDILRKSDDAATKEIIDTGRLAPSNSFVKLVLPFISQPELRDKPLILSSIGRWHGEEEAVMSHTEQSNHPMKAVIYLDTPPSSFYDRWAKAKDLGDREERNDDREEYLETRLLEFKQKTLPVLDYYRNLGLLIEVDGTNDKDTVTEDILEALLKRAS